MDDITAGKLAALRALREQCYNCTRCALHQVSPPTDRATNGPHVFGEGWVNAPIMLVGQNPGLNEVEEGRPFVGKAGKQLDRAIAAAGLRRDRMYIFNSVLCFTYGNALPEDWAMEACKYYLSAAIRAVNPKVVVAMGKSACRPFGIRYSVSLTRKGKPIKCEQHPKVLPAVHPMYTGYEPKAFDWLVASLKRASILTA